ncbi:Tox-REase-5 domain-containing protein [Roseobacter weihaiensis]|uniref:Tox-REase-5 domain-containing protein n=1 Tax=Roseobacter weihaiensis TaxID=2763262 RepID=UPI0029CAAD49|nr:Tox-REase-5 domain-containing protein [Roseobacter sp. H9]
MCPWHWYHPEAAQIEEWVFSVVDFDGLHPAACHLYEAKHGYERFLEDDWGGGAPKLRRWIQNSKGFDAFDRIVTQGRNQHTAVAPHFGEVELTWVFSHMITRLYVGDLLLREVEGWYHEMEARTWERG